MNSFKEMSTLPKLLLRLTYMSRFNFCCSKMITSDRHRLQENQLNIVRSRLESALGKGNISSAETVCQQHSGIEAIGTNSPPDLVVWPQSTEEVSVVAKICHENLVPMVPFGTGTGMEGGVSAIQGGVCVDMSMMKEILSFHPEDFDVTVQPGVTRHMLDHHLKGYGLWFPVDPGADASLCGMVATSASGTNAVRYGTMRENVLNLEIVLADGRRFFTAGDNRRAKKTVAGFNLTNLFIGSEGSLGFITQSTLKLHALPETMLSAICAFPSVKAAVDTCIQILQASIPIARIELMDDIAMDLCNRYDGVNYLVTPTLFLEFHGSEGTVASQIKEVGEIAGYNGGSDFEWAQNSEDRNRLWKARHNVFYATINSKPGCRVIVTDVCVPISKLPELVVETKEDMQKSGVSGPILGHVGDGNFHSLLLFDPGDVSTYQKAKEVVDRLAKRALFLGGSCTGEHGIGVGKVDLLKQEIGPVGIQVMKNIKTALDPHILMNPGKVICYSD